MTSHHLFTHVQTEGGLLPSSLLPRLADDRSGVDGLSPASYGLSGERVAEATARSWGRLTAAWEAFRSAREKLAEDDSATGVTRDRWLMPILQELGFGRLPAARATTIDEKDYPISHFYGESVPVHLVGAGVSLDRRTPGVRGAAQASPHSLVQEFLNRSDDHLWGIVTNGLRFRILRDNIRLTRPAFVEFDLEGMFEGEAYADFALLWRVAHVSRFDGETPEQCCLERWTELAQAEGSRVLGGLRVGVEEALTALGRGFLAQRKNTALRQRLEDGSLSREDYYRQLLRLVYRLLFLFVAEDRGLLHPPHDPADRGAERARERYRRYASTTRLRELSRKMRGTQHTDLFAGLQAVMRALGEDGAPAWGLPALGSDLWAGESLADLDAACLSNRALLDAVRALATTQADGVRQAVDYRNLGSEELGSVYESLLELHPQIETKAGHFELQGAAGHERKTTGSYYTPRSLISCLLDSALEPVLDDAAKQGEEAILALKVCDPACGSGHFLIAAAQRIGKRLAAVRTGEEEPAPEYVRTAIRDVVGRCLYGVDLNPMAVELCKVSLWLEALDPGKPLTFLDHHIRRGNSLLGATPRLMAEGIPDDAFVPLEGDDRATARDMKRANRTERGSRDTKEEIKSQGTLFSFSGEELLPPLQATSRAMAAIAAIDDDTIEGQREKVARYREYQGSDNLHHARLAADAWCAAFVWPLTGDEPRPPTDEPYRELLRDPNRVAPETRECIAKLARQYHFFHFHVAFPDVFQVAAETGADEPSMTGLAGGFDLVLGNPPWEHTELKEKEWFAVRRPDIAAASGAKRKRLIAALEHDQDSHGLFLEFRAALRQADSLSHFVRKSSRFPLCGRGRINTYAIFAELKRDLMGRRGRVGTIVPSGIATDDTTKFFFQDLVERAQLASLLDFENRKGIFTGVHRSYKFCLLTLTGLDRPATEGGEFAFFLHSVDEVEDEDRRFHLDAEDIARLNPNTKTCPIFRTQRDAEITKGIYERVPVLLREDPEENPWGVRFARMFDMSNDSGLFRTRDELEGAGWTLAGNIFERGDGRYLPLYEAKMIHHYDHRYGDYADHPPGAAGTQLPDVPIERKQDPTYAPLPRYWVPEAEVESRLADRWPHPWLLGWRDICRSTDERTVIASVLPRVGVGNNMPLMFPAERWSGLSPMLVANLCSFVLDFATRFKVGGTHLNFFIFQQVPVLPPEIYEQPCPWDSTTTVSDWLAPRLAILMGTDESLSSLAELLTGNSQIARWNEEERALARARVDAAFLHLYGISRSEAEYILDTFPIVQRNDLQVHGEFRTKQLILAEFDTLREAMTELVQKDSGESA